MKLKNTEKQEMTENEFFNALLKNLEKANANNSWESIRVTIVTSVGDDEYSTTGRFTRGNKS